MMREAVVAIEDARFLDHPGIDLDPYRRHLRLLKTDAGDRIATLRRGMSENEAVARVLADTIASRHGYAGDHDTYDDPQNADLIRVIDRRRGLPARHLGHRPGRGGQGRRDRDAGQRTAEGSRGASAADRGDDRRLPSRRLLRALPGAREIGRAHV